MEGNFKDVTHFDDRPMYDDQKKCERVFGKESTDDISDINIYDMRGIHSEIIKMVNRAYRKGVYNGKQIRDKELKEEKTEKRQNLCETCIYLLSQHREDSTVDDYCTYINSRPWQPVHGCTGYTTNKKPFVFDLCKLCLRYDQDEHKCSLGNNPDNVAKYPACEEFLNRGAHSCTECIYYKKIKEYLFGKEKQTEYCTHWDAQLEDTEPCNDYNEYGPYKDTLCKKCRYGVLQDCEDEAYYCLQYKRVLDNVNGCAEYKGKDHNECKDCIFRVQKDGKIICKNYSDMPIPTGNVASCNECMTKDDCEEYNMTPEAMIVLIEAFNYFKMDGGCDCCGSQSCPADAQMLLHGNFCEEFKKWIRED